LINEEQGTDSVFGLYLPELKEKVAAIGEKPFRAKQIMDAVYRQNRVSLQDIATLPAALRQHLEGQLSLDLPKLETVVGGEEDGALKFLLNLHDGQNVEMVRISDLKGDTLCVSSQVGCGLGCDYCATGSMGLRRDLEASEIVAQVVFASRHSSPPRNIVFMGMGEPFHNYDATLRALKIMIGKETLAYSPRRITVSTAGMVPEIYRFAEENLAVTLAISLGGSNHEIRSRLIPLGAVYSIDDIQRAARHYAEKTGRRITYEYLMMNGHTDRSKDAERLIKRFSDDLCHFNLIEYNTVPGIDFRASSREKNRRFRDELKQAGIPVSIRRSKGKKIAAACGQLAGGGQRPQA
jgi:23S rRNA (adenine2503-C2)-methyltransferase